jgi:hypothetical protein
VNFANCIANWFPSGSVPTELTAGVVVPTYHLEFRYVAVATDGADGAFGARLYEIVINGFADPCADKNFFHPYTSDSESARNVNPTCDNDVDDHAFAADVISTDTRPAAHDDEYPFATLTEPRFVPAPGWFDHRVDDDVNAASNTENDRAEHEYEYVSYRLNAPDTIDRPLNMYESNVRNDRATTPDPNVPTRNSDDPDRSDVVSLCTYVSNAAIE